MSVFNPEKQTRLSQNHLISFEDTSIAFSPRSDKDLLKMYWLFASMNNRSLVKAGTFSESAPTHQIADSSHHF
jgi:hypothetical protein